MRVTDASIYRFFLASLESGNETVSRALGQISDLKRVRVASDDPAAARVALGLRGQLVRSEGFERSAFSAKSDLALVEDRMSAMFSLITQATTEAQAAASGTNELALGASANLIDDIRDQMIQLANTEQGGRYLFGGTNTLTPPFDAAGTYAGNSVGVEAPIGTTESVAVTVDGSAVLTGAGNVLTTLENLAAAMRANDVPAMTTAMAELDAEQTNLSEIRTEIGVRLQRIDATIERLDDEQFRLQARIIDVEDVDLPRAAVELAEAANSSEALSQSAVRVLGRSLFDFLG